MDIFSPRDLQFEEGIARKVAEIALTADASQPVNVLLSTEYDGLYKNGGIGTYFRQAAKVLAENRRIVIGIEAQWSRHWNIFNPPLPEFHALFSLADIYSLDRAVEVNTVTSFWERDFGGLGKSFAAFCLLCAIANATDRNRQLVLETHEMLGIGYHSVEALRSGYLSRAAISIVGTHSPHDWIHVANEDFGKALGRGHWPRVKEAERLSFEHADVPFSPSKFLLLRERELGWRTEHAAHLPYPVPEVRDARPRPDPAAPKQLADQSGQMIVFYGRLEERKGVFDFCSALLELPEETRKRVRVLFLGKSVQMPAGDPSIAVIGHKLAGRVAFTIESDLDRQDALERVIALNNPVVVLGSTEDNFPNAALELAQVDCRLVVRAGSGLEEAVRYCGDWGKVFPYGTRTRPSMAKTIVSALLVPRTTRILLEPDRRLELNNEYLAHRDRLVGEAFERSAPDSSPSVALLVDTRFGVDHLRSCLMSIAAQEFDGPIDVCVVSNRTGPDLPDPTHLRNAGDADVRFGFVEVGTDISTAGLRMNFVEGADGDWVGFIDADVSLRPTAVSQLVRAGDRSAASLLMSHEVLDLAGKLVLRPALFGFTDSPADGRWFGRGLALYRRSAIADGSILGLFVNDDRIHTEILDAVMSIAWYATNGTGVVLPDPISTRLGTRQPADLDSKRRSYFVQLALTQILSGLGQRRLLRLALMQDRRSSPDEGPQTNYLRADGRLDFG